MPSAAVVLPLLFIIAVKALALVLMGGLAAWSLRRSSAACRHLLWTAVVGGVLAVAVASPFPSPWHVSMADSVRLAGLPGGEEALRFLRLETISASRAPVDESSLPPAGDPDGPVRALAGFLALLWVAGAAYCAARIVMGQLALRRLAAAGRSLEVGVTRSLLSSARSPRVRLIEVTALPAPATWGILHPVVALPAAWRSWPVSGLEAALRHELAHVRRRDTLTRLVADLCCALLWFHPAVRLAARRMRWESERACDDAVLMGGSSGIDYATWLVTLAERLSRGGHPMHAGISMTAGDGLERRVRALLDPATRRASPRWALVSIAMAVVLVTLATAGLEAGSDVHPSVEERAIASDDLRLGERPPLTDLIERRALARGFTPRDEREALAFEQLQRAARHVKQHDLDFIRERGVWALSVARENEVIAPLIEALSSADWRERAAAAWCLDVTGAAGDAREGLIANLRDPVWRVRAMAATALVRTADPRATDAMLPLLDDAAWQVRLPVVQFLAREGSSAAMEAVRTRRNDPHVAVRSAARAALDETGAP